VEIHQVTVGAAYGDAISNEVLTIRGLLRAHGPSEYYASLIDPRVDALPLDAYAGRESAAVGSNLLVLHSSAYDSRVHRFLMSRPERLVLRYHNMTPPAFFAPWDPDLADLLRRGREELVALVPRTVLTICDSDYNAREARSMGFANVVTVPIVRDSTLLESAATSTPAFLPGPDDGPLIVNVGRIAPNKAQHSMLAIFHVLKTYLRTDAYLVIVGGSDHSRYANAVQAFADALEIPDVYFAGRLTNEELAAVYRRADVLVSTSGHEGFGVPLAEAMSFGIPVVALGTTAVPETLGGGGLLLGSLDPLEFAEAIDRVLADTALRNEVVSAERERLQAFDPSVTGPAFLDALASAA
jgi:glycosyltransferase involved in cell wall biosynthesis